MRRTPGTRVNVLDVVRTVKLAKPRRDGDVSLERCIAQRRSVRSFRDRPMTASELGQLLWAAQGVTSADGRRSVASAGALYPLEFHAACRNVESLAAGIYRYVPAAEDLLLTAAGRQHEGLVAATGGQEWIASAPAVVCVAAAFERTTAKYGNRGRGYVYLEAGLAIESLMLQAVALGLATTAVGAFGDGDVKRLFRLGAGETPLCLLPVGAPSIG